MPERLCGKKVSWQAGLEPAYFCDDHAPSPFTVEKIYHGLMEPAAVKKNCPTKITSADDQDSKPRKTDKGDGFISKKCGSAAEHMGLDRRYGSSFYICAAHTELMEEMHLPPDVILCDLRTASGMRCQIEETFYIRYPVEDADGSEDS